MTRELKDATITHVSYVDKAANQKRFFLTKSEAAPTFNKEVKLITKADDAEQLVYGVVYEPNIEDAHGDFMVQEEIEKAAHTFLKEYRNMDTQHDFKSGVGEVVESYIAPEDFVVGTETITKGSWVMVTKASDEIWEQIQKGEITGYSMAGTAEAIEKAAEEDKMMKSFFNTLKAFFTGEKEEIQKGKVKDQYEKDAKNRNLWTALDTFAYSIKKYNWETNSYEYDSDEDIRTALTDLNEILSGILLSDNIFKAMGKPTVSIEKAGKKMSAARMEKLQAAQTALNDILAEVEEAEKEETEVTEEQLAKAIEKALEPVVEKLNTLETANGEVQKQVEDVKKEEGEKPAAEDIVKQLEAAVEKALAPINDRIEAVEKARGIKKSEEGEVNPEPVQKSVFQGLFFK